MMRLRLLPSHSSRHSRFTLANRITSLLPTIRELSDEKGVYRHLSDFASGSTLTSTGRAFRGQVFQVSSDASVSLGKAT